MLQSVADAPCRSHTLAATRLFTFEGLAGFYIPRPNTVVALDDLFQGVYDFPLVIQDKTFGTQDAANAEVCLCYSTAPQTNDLQYGVWQPVRLCSFVGRDLRP